MSSSPSIADLPDWVDQEAADDAWIYDWATTLNDPPRLEDPIETLLRESMALEPSMFDTERPQSSCSAGPPRAMSAAVQASQALTTIIEEDPAENMTFLSDQDTATCNCCAEIASLRSEMAAILQEVRGVRSSVTRNEVLENKVDLVETLSIEYMEAVRESIAILQADRSRAEEWMYQYQSWADTTHDAMQHLLSESESESERAGLVGMTPGENVE